MSGQRPEDDVPEGGAEHVQVDAGGEFTLALDDRPSAGYAWHVRLVPDGLVELETTREAYDPEELGAPAGRTLRFRAERAGRYDLVLELRREWEAPHIAPAEQRTVVVFARAPGAPPRRE